MRASGLFFFILSRQAERNVLGLSCPGPGPGSKRVELGDAAVLSSFVSFYVIDG